MSNKANGDYKTWRETAQRRVGNVCTTCKRYPNLLKDIECFAVDEANGFGISVTQFLEEYLIPRGYDMKRNALIKHINRCVRKKPNS